MILLAGWQFHPRFGPWLRRTDQTFEVIAHRRHRASKTAKPRLILPTSHYNHTPTSFTQRISTTAVPAALPLLPCVLARAGWLLYADLCRGGHDRCCLWRKQVIIKPPRNAFPFCLLPLKKSPNIDLFCSSIDVIHGKLSLITLEVILDSTARFNPRWTGGA